MESARTTRSKDEQGFALIVAILALMLLTFLGLTLATTTTTELQIATNYRWGQQALYNAEAGIEAGKRVLSQSSDPSVGWELLLPKARPGTWDKGAAPAADPPKVNDRDYEQQGCDLRSGIGYGLVLMDGAAPVSGVSTFRGQTINGAFTLWVRRRTETGTDGMYSDSLMTDSLILTAEGVAPYAAAAATPFMLANQAARIIEYPVALQVGTGNKACKQMAGQEGMGPGGENFDPCSVLRGGKGVGNAFDEPTVTSTTAR